MAFGLKELVLTLVVVGIVATFGLYIVESIQDEMTANSAAYNATADTITGVSEIPGWLQIIAIASIGVFLIALIIRSFGGKNM
jgi:hypothetical protein